MKIQISSQAQLAAIFLGLLLLFGGILGWFHHDKTSAIFLTSSKELFEQVAEDVSESFYAEYDPVSTTVRLLSLSPVTSDEDLESRISRLPVLVSVLQAQPEVVALSIGYNDAEFFIVRSLNSSYMLKRFGAPESATYVADNIERVDGQPVFHRLFFDSDLNLLEKKDMGFTSYNPTVRPWYRLAVYSKDVTTTSPYLFYFIGKVGVTVVKEESGSGNVFAADITLESLSNTLIRNRVSPSAHMLIYTSDNEVIASLDPDSILVNSGEENLSIAKLTDLENPVVTDFFRQTPQANNSHFFLDSGGTNWIGINKPISLVGFTANLLILAPEAELLDEAYAIRNQSTVISVAIIILSLPLAFVVARQMARPLKTLAKRAEPIRRFDFSKKVTDSTSVSDIQRLESALDLTRNTTYGFSKLFRVVNSETDSVRLTQEVSKELLKITEGEGVLIYLCHHSEDLLIPDCFVTRHGIKLNHNFPRISIQDTSLALVSAFQKTGSTVLEINHEQIASTGTHESLLNYLGAERLTNVAIPLLSRNGEKFGLLCLMFGNAEVVPFNVDRIQFYESLASFCGIALEPSSRSRSKQKIW